MKITVVTNTKSISKPKFICPWLIDDPTDPGPDKR